MIEEKLKEKISGLEKTIALRETDEWKNKDRLPHKYDTNGYFWNHCGESQEYEGRLQGLKQALEIIKQSEKK